jgi:uracil-DNA glycosylase
MTASVKRSHPFWLCDAAFVDSSRHLVLKAAHPSPLSAYNGFLGCRHFSQTNAFLEKHGQPPIDWSLPDVV